MDEILIETYSPSWQREFQRIARTIRRALDSVAVRIDHIGSTSIVGMDAKPIIDIQISVERFEPLAAYAEPLHDLGYVHKKDNPTLTKRYFREAPGSQRTHIHVREVGTWNQQLVLVFRDYLRNNEIDARLYTAEKHRLAALYRTNRVAYTEAKAKVIWEILSRADAWVSRVGWRPGDSDM